MKLDPLIKLLFKITSIFPSNITSLWKLLGLDFTISISLESIGSMLNSVLISSSKTFPDKSFIVLLGTVTLYDPSGKSLLSKLTIRSFPIIFEYMFSREDLQKKTIIGVVLAMSGTIIISIGDINILFTRIWGDLLAFTAGLFAALYLFIGRSLRKKLDYFPYIYVVYTYAALFIAICVLITGIPFSGYNRINYLYFFILAIGPTLIGHSIFNYSVRFIPVSIVSLSLLAEPLLATILARLILGEVIVPVTVCGGVIILSGIYIATRQK